MALAFFSAFLWALFWVINNMNRKTDSSVSLFLSFFFGSLFLFAGAPFADVSLHCGNGLYASVYIGLFEMGIPFTFFGLALRYTNNPALINQLCFIFPFISLIFIHYILGEHIYLTTVTGLFLIIAGIIFNERKR
jgi:drug/metabolite transporter (DMT)-like permease